MATVSGMRWKRSLYSYIYVFFGLVILGTLFFTQKPLCINSKVVERIDRVSDSGTETVWRCSLQKNVSYSPWFAAQLPALTARIQKMESNLESLEKISSARKNVGKSEKRLVLNIWVEDQDLFRKQGSQVYLNERLALEPQVLERIIAKNWIDSKLSPDQLGMGTLVNEAAVDSLIAFLQGVDSFERLEIVDPQTGLKIQPETVAWPSVLKTKKAYCRSAWISIEHLEACQKLDLGQNQNAEMGQLTPLSLRPLLTKLWMDSYRALYSSEQFHFRSSYALYLRDLALKMNEVSGDSMSKDLLSEVGLLSKALQLQIVVVKKTLTSEEQAQKQFAANLYSRITNLGLLENQGEARFDLLYHLSSNLDGQRDLLNDLRKLAKKNPNKQIAIEDPENIWMLPSMTAISKSHFKAINSDKIVAEHCGDFSMTQVLQFAERTDKLLLVVRCANDKEIDVAGFLTEGARSFAMQNPQVSFVSIHLPSVMMKKVELENTERLITELRSDSEVKKSVAKSLGWQNIEWFQKEKAYAPRANIEGIQLFR